MRIFNSVMALDPSQNFVSAQYLKMHNIDKILVRVCKIYKTVTVVDLCKHFVSVQYLKK